MPIGFNGTVRINRMKLLEALDSNRDKHAAMYAEAVTGWVAECRRRFGRLADAMESGDPKKLRNVAHGFAFPAAPTSYITEYDTAIKMFEMSTEAEIALNAQEFRALVEDQWEWKRSWIGSNAGYSDTIRAESAKDV